MSETAFAPVAVGGGAKGSRKTVIVLALLGVLLVAMALVVMPKLLGGGSEPTPTPRATAAGARSTSATPTAGRSTSAAPTSTTTPPERPRRSPFDAPR